MEFKTQVARMLHDEHVRTLGLLERLEGVFDRWGARRPPGPGESEFIMTLDDLIGTVEGEIGAHFGFEEEALFPRISGAGDRSLAELLEEEHRTILPLAESVCAMARSGRRDGFPSEKWRDFSRTSRELIERMVVHIQKEEVGLLPLLDDILDDDVDGELSMVYAERR